MLRKRGRTIRQKYQKKLRESGEIDSDVEQTDTSAIYPPWNFAVAPNFEFTIENPVAFPPATPETEDLRNDLLTKLRLAYSRQCNLQVSAFSTLRFDCFVSVTLPHPSNHSTDG